MKSNERQRFKDRERLRPLLALSLSGCGIVGGFIPVVGRDIFSPLSYALLLTNMQTHTHTSTHIMYRKIYGGQSKEPTFWPDRKRTGRFSGPGSDIKSVPKHTLIQTSVHKHTYTPLSTFSALSV